MKFDDFIGHIGGLSCIDTDVLLAGQTNPGPFKVQLSRWTKSGKLIQLKRGVYVLNQPYRKFEISELAIAAVLKKPSYISIEKALEYHGLIPEAVYTITSVTTKRTTAYETELGNFDYRHIRPSLFWGYETVRHNNHTAFIACAEKALLDLFYLKNVPVSFEYIDEMRLQNTGKICLSRLKQYARKFDKPKILKTANALCKYFENKKSGKNL